MQHKTLKKHDYTEMEGRALGIKYEALFKKLLKKYVFPWLHSEWDLHHVMLNLLL